MAINLSANTQTTGSVSQEVFDPNIGFKSGLEGLARGIGQAGQAAGDLAQKMHAKKVNVNKSLASTNSTVYQTQMDTDFRTLQSVLKDPNATEEAMAAAEAAVSQYGTIGYSNLDTSGEVPEDYYSNYLSTLQARYKAHLADVEVVKESKKQLKVVQGEIAGADFTNDALVGAPSSQYVRDSVTAIRSTFSPNSGSSIERLNDRTASNKALFTALTQTLDTTLLKLPELDVTKQSTELDLLEQEILRLSDSANLNEDIKANPVLTKASNDALAKIARAKANLGQAGDAQRKLAHEQSDARIVNNLEVAVIAAENTADPVTGVATLTGNHLLNFAEGSVNGLSEEAKDSQINTANKSIIDVSVRRAQADFDEEGPAVDQDISYIGASLKTFIETGNYTINPEAFIIRNVDGTIISDTSALAGQADTQEQLIGLVTEELDVVKNGLAAGDFSVLARIDGAYGKAWKTVNDLTVDVNTRAQAWEKLHSISEAYRGNPAYTELFAGVQGFAVMPDRGKVTFSELSSSERLNYIDEFIGLNGSEASVRAAIAALSYSNNDSSVIGALAIMRLEGNGMAEKALSYIDTSTDIYNGVSVQVEDGEGEKTLESSSVKIAYDAIINQGVITPFGLHRLAAERANNPALAKMYQDIEIGMLASSMRLANPKAPAGALLGKLIRTQKSFTSSLGHKMLTSNGTITTIPDYDLNNKKQADLAKFGNRHMGVEKPLDLESTLAVAVYERSYKAALKDALISQNVPASSKLRLVEYAKKNDALRQALSEDTIDTEEEMDKYIEGLFANDSYNQTHAMLDLSEIRTIDGVDYVVPRFFNGEIYEHLVLDTKKPFMFPLNSVHDKAHKELILSELKVPRYLGVY